MEGSVEMEEEQMVQTEVQVDKRKPQAQTGRSRALRAPESFTARLRVSLPITCQISTTLSSMACQRMQ
jgi:hypothetical protein